MRYVPQRTDTDCAIAVSAMVSGRSYVEVAEIAKLPPGHGRTQLQMRRLLSRLLGEVRLRYTINTLMREVVLPEGRAAILIVKPRGCLGHWIAVEKKNGVVRVFDPELRRPVKLGRYRRGAWRSYCVIV